MLKPVSLDQLFIKNTDRAVLLFPGRKPTYQGWNVQSAKSKGQSPCSYCLYTSKTGTGQVYRVGILFKWIRSGIKKETAICIDNYGKNPNLDIYRVNEDYTLGDNFKF